MSKRTIGWCLAAIFFGASVGAAIALFTGCVGAPKSVEELEAMDDAAFESWSDRIGLLAAAVGQKIQPDEARVAAASLRLSASPSVAQAVEAAGVDDPLALLAAGEIDAMIGTHGGWPVGPRAAVLLEKIAAGLEAGAQTPTKD